METNLIGDQEHNGVNRLPGSAYCSIIGKQVAVEQEIQPLVLSQGRATWWRCVTCRGYHILVEETGKHYWYCDPVTSP
jgi:hypothetical protein